MAYMKKKTHKSGRNLNTGGVFDEEESIESDEGDRKGGEEDARRLCCRHKLAHILLSMCLLMALMRGCFVVR